jgi:uncharacterized protein (DUF433 family)
MEQPLKDHIETTPGICGGKPRIAGHRIKVSDVAIWHERLGMTADEIASTYKIALADVHAALAYYFDHTEEIEAEIREGKRVAEELRALTPSKLRAKLGGA